MIHEEINSKLNSWHSVQIFSVSVCYLKMQTLKYIKLQFCFVSHIIKERTQIDNIWEQGAEEDIWGSNKRSEKLHNKDLHNLYSTNVIRIVKSRRVRSAGHVARMRDEKCTQGRKTRMGKFHERSKRRWEYNLIHAAQDTRQRQVLVNTVTKIWVS